MPWWDSELLPIIEGPRRYDVPEFGRTLVIPPALRIPTGPNQIAIDIRFPNVESSYACTVICCDQVLQPGNNYSWMDGVYGENLWYAKFGRIHMHGAGGVSTPSMRNGITLTGRSNSVSIHGYHAMGMTTALLITGQTEATRLVDYEFLSCMHGVAAITSNLSPGLVVAHGHIHCTSAAFLFQNQRQFYVADSLVYAANGFTETKSWDFYTGLLLGDCADGVFEDVRVGSMAPEKTVFTPLIAGGERIKRGAERLNF